MDRPIDGNAGAAGALTCGWPAIGSGVVGAPDRIRGAGRIRGRPGSLPALKAERFMEPLKRGGIGNQNCRGLASARPQIEAGLARGMRVPGWGG